MKIAKKIIPLILLIVVAVFCVTFFSACIDVDYAKVSEKLRSDKYGYSVSSFENEDIPGCTQCIKAAKNQEGDRADYEYVYIIYFTDIDAAIDYYETEFKESVERLKEDPQYSLLGEISYKRVSNIILFGTPGGVKDALA